MNTININGKTYNAPALNAGQVRKNLPALVEVIQALDAANGAEALPLFGGMITAMADLVFTALKSTYPHITQDEVDTLHVPELQQAMEAIITATGLGAAPGEVKAPGKARR